MAFGSASTGDSGSCSALHLPPAFALAFVSARAGVVNVKGLLTALDLPAPFEYRIDVDGVLYCIVDVAAGSETNSDNVAEAGSAS